MQYVIKDNETVFDAAIMLYGRSEFALKLIKENSDLISFDSFPAGVVIEYDAEFKQEMLQFFPLPTAPVNTEIPIYQILTNQSAYDLSVMWGYGIERMVEFMQSAGIDGLLDQDLSGQTFQLSKLNTNLSNYLTSKQISFATNATEIIDTNDYFLLMETGDFLLLESGDKIIL
mgnify:CR=1 FL=1